MPATLSDEDKEDLLELTHSAIQFFLANEVVEEKTNARLWLRLESQLMIKSHKPSIHEAMIIHNSYERRYMSI